VEVFKLANMREWRLSEKVGDVTEVLDKTTAKRVFKIAGSVSAANYILCPKAKTELKSLELTGRYVYVEMSVPTGKLYSTHLDFIVNNRKTGGEDVIRVTLSNIFKAVKGTSSVIQVAFHPSEKWTVLVLSVPDLLRMYIGPHVHSHVLRSFTACSTQLLRGIFTSDILYVPLSLPRELAFKLSKDQVWTEVYDWLEVPEASAREMEMEETGYEGNQPALSLPSVPEEPFIETKVTYESRELKKQVERAPMPPVQSSLKPQTDTRKGLDPVASSSPRPIAEERKKTPSPRKESPRRKENVSPRPAERPNEVLYPDPIMSLKHIVGYSGTSHSNIKWSKQGSNFTCYPSEFTQGSNKFMFYPSGCSLIALNPKTQKQHFFFGHTAPINSLAISLDGELLASGQEGKSPTILVWELKNRRAPTYITLSKILSLASIDISPRNNHLVAVGKDAKARELIMIWDISPIPRGQKPELVAKQVSDFHINTIKFVPFDEGKLVSCGRENIRFWRIKDGHLPGTAVVLNHHARNTEFTDLDFDWGTGSMKSREADASLKRVFVSSGFGMVFQVNYQSKELEGVFQLHDQGIISLKVTEGFCVTGSKDRFLRIWPLDFSEFFLEAQHEDGVCAVDVTWDGLLVACGTSNCNLGLLDMNTNAYRTILRSHKSTIIALDVHRISGDILTISTDRTIRVWKKETFEESYEFTSPQDEPLVASFHPTTESFACGFRSGYLRLFDVPSTAVKDEFLQHESAIMVVTHSGDGKLLLTASEDAQFCVYDVMRKYQPVKTLPVELQGEAVAACFSPDSHQFAVLGNNGNSISLWDSFTFTLKFHITPNTFIYGIAFAPNGQDLLALTKSAEWRLRYYGLDGFKAEVIKEIAGMHPNSVMQALALTMNSKYVVTGGNDRIIKVWDYAMKPTASPQHQAFIGHSGSVSNLIFSTDNRYLISTAEGSDGLFIWAFQGDVRMEVPSNAPPMVIEPAKIIEEESLQDILASVESGPPAPTLARVITEERSESKTPRLSPIEPGLVAKHYRPLTGLKRDPPPDTMDVPKAGEDAFDLQALIGYSGTQHDNLLWVPEEGWIIHSIGTNVIRTILRQGKQVVMSKHMDEISTLKLSPSGKILGSAAGCAEFENHAQVVLWDIATGDPIRTLSFHERGVQTLAFSPNSQLLCSIGTQTDGVLVIWDIGTGRVMATSSLSAAIHACAWSPSSNSEFATAGDSGLTLWKLTDRGELLLRSPVLPKAGMVLTAVEYTKDGDLLLGSKTGSVLIYSVSSDRILAEQVALGGEIDSISLLSDRLIVSGQSPHINSWSLPSPSDLIPALTRGHPDVLLLDSAVSAQSFEGSGNEGVVGTSVGTIWYVNLMEKSAVRVVSSHYAEEVVVAASAGKYVSSLSSDGVVKVWNERNWSQVMSGYREEAKALTLATHSDGRYLAVGQMGGTVEIFDLNQLKSLGRAVICQTDITCVTFTSSDALLIGTDTGVIYLLSILSWSPLHIQFTELTSAGSDIQSLSLLNSHCLASTSQGKVCVWTDSCAQAFSRDTRKDTFEVRDIFAIMDNPHGLEESDVELYKYQESFRTQACFLAERKNVYVAITSSLQYVFFRDFDTREVLHRLPLLHFPMSLSVSPSSQALVIGTTDRLVQVYSLDSEEHQDYLVHSHAVSALCVWKGLVVSGSLGELAVWRLK
jgi:WD40 repeat protein